MPRRFPPPWSVEETDACFIVREIDGHRLQKTRMNIELARAK
jgi:hypothetical protein